MKQNRKGLYRIFNPMNDAVCVDITNEIDNNNKLFPIPLTLTHKIMYNYDSALYKLVCRFCGDEITGFSSFLGEYKNMPSAFRYIVDKVFDHLLLHRFQPLHLHMKNTCDEHISSGVYIVFGRRSNKIIDITSIFQNSVQLLMIIRSDPNVNSLDFRNQLLQNERPLVYFGRVSSGHKCYSLLHEEEFMENYVNIISRWDFDCIFCGETYEGGLPSVDLVVNHIKDCIPKFDASTRKIYPIGPAQ